MENVTFTQLDITLMQRELPQKTYADIAFLLDRSVEEVAAFINDYCRDSGLISYQQTLDQKRKTREPKPQQRKEKKKPAKVISRILNTDQQKVNEGRVRVRAGQVIYKTKKVDYTQLQTVRIDDKTVIYCKPGETPTDARERYFNNKLNKQFQAPGEREATLRKIV